MVFSVVWQVLLPQAQLCYSTGSTASALGTYFPLAEKRTLVLVLHEMTHLVL